METAECRACKAPMIWATTERGKAMPLDADPVEDGTFGLFEQDGIRGDRPQVLAVFHTRARDRSDWDGELYKPHWATCPEAGSFR